MENDKFTVMDDTIGEIHLSRAKRIKEDHSEKRPSTKPRAADVRRGVNTKVRKDAVRIPPSQDDIHALNDFNKSMNDVITKMSMGQLKPFAGKAPYSVIGEELLTPNLMELASACANAVKAYADAVTRSESGFYPPSFKSEMKETSENIKQSQAGGDIRHLRYFFMNYNKFMTMTKIPEIEPGMLGSFDDFVRFRNLYSFDKFFDAGVDCQNSRNSLHTMKDDARGGVDIHLSYYLHVLPVTPALKNALSDIGVSDDYLAPLGNWRIDKSKAIDEDEKFSASHFICDDGMLEAGVHSFASYTGPEMYDPIVKDLLDFCKSFVERATYVRAPGADPNVTSDYTVGASINLFNPNLAIKIWMMTAMNAVYKVLVEDGLGTISRVNDAVSRTVNNYKPMSLYDAASLVVGSSMSMFSELKSAVAESFRNLGDMIYYNDVVYQFIKDRFAPITQKYTVKTSQKFIANNAVGEMTHYVSIIPELVLPLNPYDAQIDYYETTSHRKELPVRADMVEGRNVYFMPYTVEKVEMDKRSQRLKESSTYYFDNMLSYGLHVVSKNDVYNIHTYGYKVVVPTGKLDGTTQNACRRKNALLKTGCAKDCLGIPSPDVAGADDNYIGVGPWISKTPQAAVGSNTDSCLAMDLHSSFINRDVIMGYAGYQEFIHPVTGRVITEESADNKLSWVGFPYRMSIRHTNPISVRLAATMPWFMSNAQYLATKRAMHSRWVGFLEYVIKESGMSRPIWTTSQACKEPTFQAKSADCGGLTPKDFFRYSFVLDGTNRYCLIDNATHDKLSTLLNSVEKDGEYKRDGAYVVGLSKTDKLTADIVNSAVPAVDGSVYRFDGFYTYTDCSRIQGAVCMQGGSLVSHGSVPEYVTITSAAASGFFTNPGSYIRISKPVLKCPYTFDSNGRPYFAAKHREVNTFSTVVDVSSFEAWKYSVSDGKVAFTAPTANTPATLANLIAGSREKINNAVAAWKEVVEDVLYHYSNYDAVERDEKLEPTMIALASIFRPFENASAITTESQACINGVGFDAAKKAGDELKILTKWSCSAPFIIVSGTSNGNASDIDACVLDGNAYCAAHGCGILTTACEYSNDKVTFEVMKALGIPMVSQHYVSSTMYLRVLPHNMSLYIQSVLPKAPKRRSVYMNKNKDILAANNYRENQFNDHS